MRAAIDNPKAVLVPFALSSNTARYIRLQLEESSDKAPWVVTELSSEGRCADWNHELLRRVRLRKADHLHVDQAGRLPRRHRRPLRDLRPSLRTDDPQRAVRLQ